MNSKIDSISYKNYLMMYEILISIQSINLVNYLLKKIKGLNAKSSYKKIEKLEKKRGLLNSS